MAAGWGWGWCRGCLLLLLVLALSRGEQGEAKRVKRQHNLYSVNDFLSQLGALATASQGQSGGGGPSNYLANLLQAYQRPQHRPQAGYPPQGYPHQSYPQQDYLAQGYPQGYPQRPEYLQDLQYQQNPSQQVLGFDPNAGFGLQPGRPGFVGGAPSRPPLPLPLSPLSLTAALQSVARYDDARCVPRLLCELTAGGRPGDAKQNQAVPFVNRDTLLSLLTVLNFGSDSPLLVFGRAALLGYMAQGDPSSCLSAYPTCPRDPDRLVDYLNNHNGGFFRFFTGVGNPAYQQQQQHQYQQQLQQYYQGYRPSHYAPQFRHNALPHQQQAKLEARILTKVHPIEAASSSSPFASSEGGSDYFLPTPRPEGHRAGRKHNAFKFPRPDEDNPLNNAVAADSIPTSQIPFYHDGHQEGGQQETVFINGQPVPQHYLEGGGDAGDGTSFTLDDGEYTFTNPYAVKSTATGDRVKTFTFPAIRVGSPVDIEKDNSDGAYSAVRPYIPNIPLQKPSTPVMIFPTRTGTGDLRLDPADHFKLASSSSKPFTFAQDKDQGASAPFRDEYVVHGMYQTESAHPVGGAGYRQGHAFRFPSEQTNGGLAIKY